MKISHYVSKYAFGGEGESEVHWVFRTPMPIPWIQKSNVQCGAKAYDENGIETLSKQ